MRRVKKGLFYLSVAGVFICVFDKTLAQNEKIESFVVVKTDTLYGMIKTTRSDINPGKISFKKYEDEYWIDFSPNQITAFGVNGLSFESQRVTTDFASQKLEDVVSNLNKERLVDSTLFLQYVLHTQILKLYRFTDGNGVEHYYFKKNAMAAQELRRRPYVLNGKVGYRNLYYGTLKSIFEDCPSITEKEITNTKFQIADFKNIASKYLNCKGVKPISQNNAVTQSNIHVYIGVGLNNLSFSSPTSLKFSGLAAGNFNNPVFQAGISYQVFPFRLNKKASFVGDLGFRYYSGNSTVYSSSLSAGNITQKYSLSFTYFKFSPYLRYSFFESKSNVSIFGDVGGSFNYLGNINSSYELSTTSAGVQVKGEALTSDEYKRIELSYFIGVGLKVNRFSAAIRLEQGDGVVQVSSSKSTATSLFAAYTIRK